MSTSPDYFEQADASDVVDPCRNLGCSRKPHPVMAIHPRSKIAARDPHAKQQLSSGDSGYCMRCITVGHEAHSIVCMQNRKSHSAAHDHDPAGVFRQSSGLQELPGLILFQCLQMQILNVTIDEQQEAYHVPCPCMHPGHCVPMAHLHLYHMLQPVSHGRPGTELPHMVLHRVQHLCMGADTCVQTHSESQITVHPGWLVARCGTQMKICIQVTSIACLFHDECQVANRPGTG